MTEIYDGTCTTGNSSARMWGIGGVLIVEVDLPCSLPDGHVGVHEARAVETSELLFWWLTGVSFDLTPVPRVAG